ncbi:uncharacterized protein RJT21DRAFT_111843 [Scheffersomyces amazonensis]|uniref:uncharacterized protein n=1 Tax=Scheffersomyces amazonensis TaxID=1078765 RepID=UPI00315CEF64
MQIDRIFIKMWQFITNITTTISNYFNSKKTQFDTYYSVLLEKLYKPQLQLDSVLIELDLDRKMLADLVKSYLWRMVFITAITHVVTIFVGTISYLILKDYGVEVETALPIIVIIGIVIYNSFWFTLIFQLVTNFFEEMVIYLKTTTSIKFTNFDLHDCVRRLIDDRLDDIFRYLRNLNFHKIPHNTKQGN